MKTVGIRTFEQSRGAVEGTIGSTRLRVTWLCKHWPNAEVWKPGIDYEVMMYQKTFDKRSLKMMNEFRGIQIFDCCDASWLERETTFHFRACDAITTSSEKQAKYLKKLYPNKPVVHVPDRIDIDGHTAIKQKHSEKIKSVVWFGYSKNFMYIRPEFLEHLNKNKMKLTVYSEDVIGLPAEYTDIEFNWIEHPQEEIKSVLKDYDVALLPCDRHLTDEWGSYKARGKPAECYSLGLPVVEQLSDFDRLESRKSRELDAGGRLLMAREMFDIKLSVKQYENLIKQLRK